MAYNPLVRSIHTVYEGWYFRSRVEARWCVLFETLGIRYEYEPQKWMLNGLVYLPDFLLTELNTWLEIKGIEPSGEEREKARRLSVASGVPVLVMVGSPWYSVARYAFYDGHDYGKYQRQAEMTWQKYRSPRSAKGMIGLVQEGHAFKFHHLDGLAMEGAATTEALRNAYVLARHERFDAPLEERKLRGGKKVR